MRPTVGIHFDEEMEIESHGRSREFIQKGGKAFVHEGGVGFRRGLFDQPLFVMFDAELIEKGNEHGGLAVEEPILEEFEGEIFVGLTGELLADPGAAFGFRFFFEEDRAQLAAGSEQVKQLFPGVAVVLLKMEKNVVAEGNGGTGEKFVGVHQRMEFVAARED
jgi:hypothetical protein